MKDSSTSRDVLTVPKKSKKWFKIIGWFIFVSLASYIAYVIYIMEIELMAEGEMMQDFRDGKLD